MPYVSTSRNPGTPNPHAAKPGDLDHQLLWRLPESTWLRGLLLSVAITSLVAHGFSSDTLDYVLQEEPNLEKRSQLALESAEAAFKNVRDAYRTGAKEEMAVNLARIEESVNLAFTSLNLTGKNPRKYPKFFKQAEIATRNLSRRLEEFQREMTLEDQSRLDMVRVRVQQIHDELLIGLMGGKALR